MDDDFEGPEFLTFTGALEDGDLVVMKFRIHSTPNSNAIVRMASAIERHNRDCFDDFLSIVSRTMHPPKDPDDRDDFESEYKALRKVPDLVLPVDPYEYKWGEWTYHNTIPPSCRGYHYWYCPDW